MFGKKQKPTGKGIAQFAAARLPYQFEKGLEHIGDLDYYQKIYITDPIVRFNIDLPCRWVFKSNWDFVSSNEKEKEKVEKFFNDINFQNIGYSWLKDSKIFGTGFLEFTKTNLIPRDARTMYIETDAHGQILQIIQKPINKSAEDFIEFKPEEIIILKNNSLSDNPYGISDIECVTYLVSYLKDQGERDVGAMLNKYAGERLLVKCGSEENPFSETKLKEVREYFSKLKIGEDIVYSSDIQIDVLKHGEGKANEFIPYLKYVIGNIGIGMNIPLYPIIFGDSTNIRSFEIFESYIQFLQRSVEQSLNTQLIPQLVSNDASVKIKFRPLNLNEEWVRAKKDLIDVQTTIKDVNEIRLERGLSKRKNQEKISPEEKIKIPIESKGPVAKKGIGGNLTGERKSGE